MNTDLIELATLNGQKQGLSLGISGIGIHHGAVTGKYRIVNKNVITGYLPSTTEGVAICQHNLYHITGKKGNAR